MYQTAMNTTQLGQTGLEVTRLGFGAWAIGGGNWEFGWGPQDDDESIGAIHHALELGINWIDTAAAYGFGRSEQIVGRALQGVAERPYVFTKCSLLEGPDRTVVGHPTAQHPRPHRRVDDHPDPLPLGERQDLPLNLALDQIAWALRNPAVDAAIVGFRRPDQIDPILTAGTLELTSEDIAEIEGSTR